MPQAQSQDQWVQTPQGWVAFPASMSREQIQGVLAKQSGTPIKSTATIGPQPKLAPRLAKDLALSIVDPGGAASDAWQAFKARGNPRQQEIMGNAEKLNNLVQAEGGLLSAPAALEDLPGAVRNFAREGGNAVAEFMRKPATPAQAIKGEAGTLKMQPPLHADFGLFDRIIPRGELGTETHPGPFRPIASGPIPTDELTQAVREGRAARIPVRMPKAASPEEPAPFSGVAAPTQTPVQYRGAAVTPAQEFAARQAEAKAAEPAPSGRIAAPGSEVARTPIRTGNEGRPATWTNEKVLSEAAKGNREAIAQASRRGLQLPPNTRYVMGDPDLFRASYNPREVTRFVPEGTPIRNLAPPEKSTGATLVVPPSAASKIGKGTGAVNLAAGEAPRVNPSQQMASEWHEQSRLRGVLNNPIASPEEKSYAKTILGEPMTESRPAPVSRAKLPQLMNPPNVIQEGGKYYWNPKMGWDKQELEVEPETPVAPPQ